MESNHEVLAQAITYWIHAENAWWAVVSLCQEIDELAFHYEFDDWERNEAPREKPSYVRTLHFLENGNKEINKLLLDAETLLLVEMIKAIHTDMRFERFREVFVQDDIFGEVLEELITYEDEIKSVPNLNHQAELFLQRLLEVLSDFYD